MMTDFKNLSECIAYLEKIDFENESRAHPVSKNGPERLLFMANKELVANDLALYGLKIEKIRIYTLPDSGLLAGFHLFFLAHSSLRKSIEEDIGNYHLAAGWGLDEESASDFDIFSWNYGPYEIDLHTRYRSVSDYSLGPVQNIISVGTASYRTLREVLLNAIRDQ